MGRRVQRQVQHKQEGSTPPEQGSIAAVLLHGSRLSSMSPPICATQRAADDHPQNDALAMHNDASHQRLMHCKRRLARHQSQSQRETSHGGHDTHRFGPSSDQPSIVVQEAPKPVHVDISLGLQGRLYQSAASSSHRAQARPQRDLYP